MPELPDPNTKPNGPQSPELDSTDPSRHIGRDMAGDENESSPGRMPQLPMSETGDLNAPDAPILGADMRGAGSPHHPISDEDPETGSPSPIYKVSPAEPDWSDYTLPPLNEPAPPEAETSGWQTAWGVIREVGETIILTLIIFFLIQTVVRNFRVVGTSMLGNLHDGQYLIIDKLSYNKFLKDTIGFGGPQRGDVVVFEPPNRPNDDYVKRIIGLSGETVEVRNGTVFINGEPLAEPFQPTIGSYSTPPRLVPEGQVFVLGDNRNNSNDSHTWGPLPIDNIVGRAWLSYWPPEYWGVIPRDAPTEEATLNHFLNELIPSANAESE